MAPEIIEGRAYSGAAVDIYALGVVLFAMVTRSTPFGALSRLGSDQTVLATDRLYQLFCLDKATFYARFESSMSLSAEFKSLMDAMLNPNPELRTTHAELLMHPWVVSQTMSADEARADMRDRKAAKDGKAVPMPRMESRSGARQAVRSGPKVGGKTYCVGPLPAGQEAEENVVALSLNTHVSGQNLPGSSFMYAAIAAPDLFDWLITVIQGREVIDEPIVD